MSAAAANHEASGVGGGEGTTRSALGSSSWSPKASSPTGVRGEIPLLSKVSDRVGLKGVSAWASDSRILDISEDVGVRLWAMEGADSVTPNRMVGGCCSGSPPRPSDSSPFRTRCRGRHRCLASHRAGSVCLRCFVGAGWTGRSRFGRGARSWRYRMRIVRSGRDVRVGTP